MGLVTFSALLGDQSPTGTYVVDTSFVLGAASGADKNSERKYRAAYELKRHLLKHQVGLVYTGVVRNEATKRLRDLLFEAVISTKFAKYPTVQRIYRTAQKHEKLKEIQKAGYVEAFELALGKDGKHLEAELGSVFFGCKYLATEEMNPKPKWENARKIMATYGLDSSDAMILNFAITQKTFAGLITMDGDFRFCNDVAKFDVVVPDSVLNQAGFRPLA